MCRSYRRIGSGMVVSESSLASAFVRSFTAQAAAPFTIENRSNNTAATATPLVLTEDPASSGLRSGFGRGNLSVYSTDVDYFSFTAAAGDRFSLTTQTPGSGSSGQRGGSSPSPPPPSAPAAPESRVGAPVPRASVPV